MQRMRLTWLLVAGCMLIGCDDGHAPPTEAETESVIQTEGNTEEAIFAVRSVAMLANALRNREVDEVQRLAFSIGRLPGDVTIAPHIGSGGSRTPFPEPMPPPQVATTACDDTGCTFDHYWEDSIYACLIAGSVRTQVVAGTQSIEIALRASNCKSATLDPTTYVNGALQVTPTTVNGAITEVTTYPDRREAPESIRYQAVTFDPGADPSTLTPVSGSISAEWTTADYDTGVYKTLAATVPFP